MRHVIKTRQIQRQIHLENTLKEPPQILVTFKTFDQSDDETRPTNKKTMTKTKTLMTMMTMMTMMTILTMGNEENDDNDTERTP